MKVEVVVLGSPSLKSLTVSVDGGKHREKKKERKKEKNPNSVAALLQKTAPNDGHTTDLTFLPIKAKQLRRPHSPCVPNGFTLRARHACDSQFRHVQAKLEKQSKPKLQKQKTLVYDILSPTSAIDDYATGLKNCQLTDIFFAGVPMAVGL